MLAASAAVEWRTSPRSSSGIWIFHRSVLMFHVFIFNSIKWKLIWEKPRWTRGDFTHVGLSKLGNTDAYSGFFNAGPNSEIINVNTPLGIFPSRYSTVYLRLSYGFSWCIAQYEAGIYLNVYFCLRYYSPFDALFLMSSLLIFKAGR